MNESDREPPQAKKPLTREDVRQLIGARLIGGREDLDLRHANLQRADLSDLDLHGADLTEANLEAANLRSANLQGCKLAGANLQGADLRRANVQGADLSHGNLQGANLRLANLQAAHLSRAEIHGADLFQANLQGADLLAAQLEAAELHWANLQGADLRWADLRRAHLANASLRDTDLEGANWGDYVLGDEISRHFRGAAYAYRTLKQRHTEAGMYTAAGEFHYREMEAWRKVAQKERRLPGTLALNASLLLYGYGERPQRVIAWAAAVVFGLALVHWLFGTVSGGFLDALYYSAVSFTALGYGASASFPQGWAGRFLGPAESLMGVFMMALFLVTFTRKMTR